MPSPSSNNNNNNIPLIPVRKDLDGNDKSARHQMQAIQPLLEGASQHTVLTNLDDIAAKLNRPATLILKYISNSLGCNSIAQHGKYILPGQPARDVLQTLIYDFIARFVLCPRCSDVGTYFFYDTHSKSKKKHELKVHCVACGKESSVMGSGVAAISGGGSNKRDVSSCNTITMMIAEKSAGSMMYDPANLPVVVANNKGLENKNNKNGNDDDDCGGGKNNHKVEQEEEEKKQQALKELEDPDNEKTWIRLANSSESNINKNNNNNNNPIETLNKVLQKEAASGSSSRMESTIELLRMKRDLNLADDEVVQLCFRSVVFNSTTNNKENKGDGEEIVDPASFVRESMTKHAAFLRTFVVTARKAISARKQLRFILELVHLCKQLNRSDLVPIGLNLFVQEQICDLGEIKMWLKMNNKNDNDEGDQNHRQQVSEFDEKVFNACEKLFQ